MPPDLIPSRVLDLDAFSYVVAHDLKAPLRSLHLFASVLHDDLDDRLTDDERLHLDALRDELRRMADLVDAVRRFADAAATHGGTTDGAAAIQEAWDAVSHEGSTLHVGPVGPLPLSPLHAATVLRALLHNAVVHNPGTTTVTVTADPDGRWLDVHDDGPGLPAPLEELAQPFRPRLEPPEGAGPGVGLALAQHVLEHHGGRLEERSTEQGTTIRVVMVAAPDV